VSPSRASTWRGGSPRWPPRGPWRARAFPKLRPRDGRHQSGRAVCGWGHVNRELLELALRSRVPAWALAARFLSHLSAVCPDCAAAMAALEQDSPGPSLLGRLFGARALGAQAHAAVRAGAALAYRPPPGTAEEAAAAHALLELVTLPPGKRPAAIRREARLQSLGLWQLLARRSLAMPPAQAEETARLALLVALRLPAQAYPELLRRACCVEAAAALARARTRAGAPARAHTALRLAERWLAEGVAEPYTQAEVRLAQAALADAEGDPARAIRHLDEAAGIFSEVEDRHREGATRIQQGTLWQARGRPREAAAALARGLALLARDQDPELADAAATALWSLLPAMADCPRGAADA